MKTKLADSSVAWVTVTPQRQQGPVPLCTSHDVHATLADSFVAWVTVTQQRQQGPVSSYTSHDVHATPSPGGSSDERVKKMMSRRLVDARWRAALASCYKTLSTVIPPKNRALRMKRISKVACSYIRSASG